MRVACGIADTVQEAVEFYNLISRFEHMPRLADPVQLGHEAPADELMLPA